MDSALEQESILTSRDMVIDERSNKSKPIWVMIYANSPKKIETKNVDSATALATEPRADSKEFYCPADSMSGQDKENPVF